MPRPQSAILPATGRFGLFMTFTLAAGADLAALRAACAALPALTAEVAARTGEPSLVSALGIGSEAWSRLCGPGRPGELAPFQAMADDGRVAPATPADLFVHIHSDRHDADFELARAVRDAFGATVDLVEEVHGFRYLGGRDLTGFVDGTENPTGDERAEVALVAAEDADFAAGSYVSIQRYIHDFSRWRGLGQSEQEAVIGRTKDDDVELDDAVKPPTAHIARVVIEEDGEELQIVRHSMPYGGTGEAGLYFIAYGRSPAPFFKMLAAMVGTAGDGHDALLSFTRPVTGASFFVPSLEMLEALG